MVKGHKPVAARKLRPSQFIYIVIGVVVGVGIHSGIHTPKVVQAVAAAPATIQATQPSPAPPIQASSITVITAKKKVKLTHADVASFGIDTDGVRKAMKNVLGDKKSPYKDIPFPKPIPARPPPKKRPILVAVSTSAGDWDKFTLPLLQYMLAMPDAMDVIVIDDGEEETLAARAAGLGYTVIRGPSKPMDKAGAINTAWVYFKHNPQYQVLFTLQNDATVTHTVFDRLLNCFQQVNNTMVLGPMINGMDIGEKTAELDEKSISWQNSNHRRNRDYYAGRVPRDTHFRLPYTLREHLGWFDRALHRAKTTNVTSAKPVEVLQSFALGFTRDMPTVPGDDSKIVEWGFNLFKHERMAMIDPKVNGREGDRTTAFTTELADPRLPQHICLNSYVFKDWTEGGLSEQWGINKWSPPAKRNPLRITPPKNAEWEKG